MFPLLPLAGWWLTKWLVVPVAALVVLTILRNYIRDPFTWLKLRPGDNPLPKAYGWPVLGIVPELLANVDSGDPYRVLSRYIDKLGKTAAMRVWGKPIVFTVDPDVAFYIVSTGFRKGLFHKGEIMRKKFAPWLGDGIFTSNGEAWKKQRAFAKELFHSASMRDHVAVFLDTAKDLADRIDGLVQASGVPTGSPTAGEVVDVQELFMRYTLDTFVKIGLGADAGAIREDNNRFQTAFDVVQTFLARRDLYGYLAPLVAWRKGFHAHLRYMDQFAETVVADHAKEASSELAKRSDLLSRMIVLQRQQQARGGAKEDELAITAKVLRDTVMNFLVAGRDTTAVTLTFCTYLLATHPDVEEKARQEFDRVLGPPGSPITLEQVKECRYTKWVLQETLRLFPPVPGDGFETTAETVLPGNYRVPQGMRVIYLSLALHRRDDVYKNALQFNPDRWNNDVAKPPRFMSFHGGPRICLGQDMAYLEATVALSVLLRRFKFEYRCPNPPKLKSAVILTAQGGMPLYVTRRSPQPTA